MTFIIGGVTCSLFGSILRKNLRNWGVVNESEKKCKKIRKIFQLCVNNNVA